MLRMENRANEIRVHARATGLVQGVGYRYFVFNTAQKLNLSGWVRNCVDGSVEVEAQGRRADIAQFLTQLKLGPRWAQVSGVNAQSIELHHGGDADEFHVKPDYRV